MNEWTRVVSQWLEAGYDYRRGTGAALRGLACVYCGDPAQTLDHVIPRVAGGPDEPDNLVPACRSCNGSKSGRQLIEWAAMLRTEVARADKRKRALQSVERMLGLPSGSIEPDSPADPATCAHDWQEIEAGRYRCAACDSPWEQAA